MSFRQQVLATFEDRAVGRIQFQFGRVRVDRHLFDRVVRAIQADEISIQQDVHLEGGARARYRHSDHSLAFAPGVTEASIRAHVYDQAIVIHESVHIFVHLHFGDRVRLINDEVDAWIAQTIYRMAHEATFAAWAEAAQSYDAEAAIFHQAARVIEEHDLMRHFAPLTGSDVEHLAAAISGHPLYSEDRQT